MLYAREAVAERTLEQGAITFLDRPAELDDMQRLLILLTPEDSAFERLIAIGRKRLPRSTRRERFWGFVVYGSKTRGLRHLTAARAFAEGTYEVKTHGPHAHLRWSLERFAFAIPIEHDADYIVTIANPDPTLWGLTEPPDLQSQLFDDIEMHVPIPTPFPLALQQRFRNRKFAQLDTMEWLDHPGAELVFLGTDEPTRLYPR